MIRFLVLMLLALSANAETYIEKMSQPDKVGHYAAGATIVAVSAIVTPGEYGPEVGLAVAATAAIGKELYDSRHKDKHRAEKADAAATVIGGALVYAALKTNQLTITRRNGTTLLVLRSQQ